MRRVTFRGLAERKLRLSLTALAIVLGVTFVTGTLVLGDTLNRTFNDLVGTAYQHVSFQIRGKATLPGADTTPNSTANRTPVPASIASAVGRVPGVAYVHGSVGGYAQFLARNGDAIGGGGGSTLGFSFDPNRGLSPYRLVAGHAPTAADDVVMDKATATKYHFALGDRVLMNLPDRAQRFTVSGIVTYGSADNLAGVTLAGFDLATAQRLFHARGMFDTISVRARPGADNVRLQRAIARVLPAGVEVVSGQTVANELSTAVNNALSFISTALLIFAAIALFVGAFTIFNTLSITVGQRTRELALLRLVGAGRGQVFRSVLGEAAVTGFAASLVGLGLGVVAALGLKALLNAFGITLPSAPLVFEARTPIVAIAVGVAVTVISAIMPARRAVRIPPVAALSEHTPDAPEALRRWRVRAGVVIAVAGVAVIAAGVSRAAVALVGLGALCVFASAAMLVPVAARPLSSALGRPLASLLGIPGRLGRENSMRNPRRTAQTAAALMIGLALVSTIAVLGASLSASAASQVDSAVNADYIVTGSGGFSRSVVPTMSHLPGVTTATAVYQGQFEFRGALTSLAAATPARLAQTVNLHIVAGSGGPAMAAGRLLVDANVARDDQLSVGSPVRVTFAQTGSVIMRVGGLFRPNPLVGSFVVGDRFFESHFDHPLPTGVLLRTAPGGPPLNAQLNRALVPYANVGFKTRAQFESAQKSKVNQQLGLVYVLLALAIVVALIGIVNTLMLSVFERTHEIGLLRAVGMKRPQVRAMIRSESVIVALFGAVVGILIGTGLAVQYAWLIGFLYLLLTFPSGRLSGRLDRWLMGLIVALLSLPVLAMLDGNKAGLRCGACPDNLIQIVHNNQEALNLLNLQRLVGSIVLVVIVAVLIRRWMRESSAGRHAVAPVLVAGCATFLVLAVTAALDLFGDPLNSLPSNVFFYLTATVPIAVMFVFLQRRLARGGVAGLVVELGAPGANTDLRGALARTLGDPSLELAFWFPAERSYVDGEGTPVRLPEGDRSRRTTLVERDGQPIAALLHDPFLDDNVELVQSVCAAASLALENERLQAELRARLVDLQASRARLVGATDAERRRIERDLHDGTQQRLVSIAMSLGLLESKLPAQEREARPLLRETREALALALEELRELTHGINPPLLVERGLAAALDELCRRAALPTRLHLRLEGRLPDQVESAAYFVASEALTNAAKHSHASEVRVVAACEGRVLTIEVADDGIGAAAAEGGSGLRGLADRVEALGGQFTMSSPPGRGTTLRAEIPCA